MWLSPLWRALQKPVLEPMALLTVVLAPVAWLANWQSYLSGWSQLAMRLTGFGRRATGQQVDRTALLATRNSPGVQAKGNLAMFHWNAGQGLRAIGCPALVVGGGNDIVTLPAAAEVIRSRVPTARLSVIEGAGHLGPIEDADAYAREIAAFAEGAFMTPRPQPPGESPERRRPPPADRLQIH